MEQTLNLMAAHDLEEVKVLVASGITKEIETVKYIVYSNNTIKQLWKR